MHARERAKKCKREREEKKIVLKYVKMSILHKVLFLLALNTAAVRFDSKEMISYELHGCVK